MKNVRLGLLAIVVVVVGVLLSDTFFTVRQHDQALVFQFGDHRRTIQNDPGLHMKLPFIQNVITYEARVLTIDPPVEQVILADQRRLNVDSFAIYRIVDPLLFYQAVSTYEVARQRVSTFINAALRGVLGNRLQIEVLSGERAGIMDDIRRRVAREAEPLGIEIVDVRIGRADVPDSTLRSVYDRMRSEREREAREYRARGEEEAQQIRARADREAAVLRAQAERQAQILRGQGDSEAIAIQAEAHSLDPAFFTFYRSLQAYREAMGDETTTMVMAPSGDFFRYFQDISGGSDGLAPATRDIDALSEDIRRLLVPADDEEAGTVGLAPTTVSVPDVLAPVTQGDDPLPTIDEDLGLGLTEDGAGVDIDSLLAPPAGDASDLPLPEATSPPGGTSGLGGTAVPSSDGGGTGVAEPAGQ